MGLGFFYKEEPRKIKRTSKENLRTPVKPKSKKLDCEACGLWEGCISPKMKPTGNMARKAMIIAEAPGKTEDKKGIQLVGDAGDLLRTVLTKLGVDLDEDFVKTNAVNCRPKDNRDPTKKEIQCCREVIVGPAMKENKPQFIWLLGKAALESFFGGRKTIDMKMKNWRGLAIPDREHNAWILPTYHPSYILRNSKDANLRMVWEADLKKMVRMLRRPYPEFEDETKMVHVLTDFEAVIHLLEGACGWEEAVFDYETTGLDPYEGNHRILSISICRDERLAYSFPYEYPSAWSDTQLVQVKRYWLAFLKSRAKKIAHNQTFEEKWSRVICGTPVNAWLHDTMVASHIIDNRGHSSGLKHQVYINWGISNYDAATAPYIKSKAGSKFNRMDECPLPTLLQYGGLDSLFTYRLKNKQDIKLQTGNLRDAFDLFQDGLETFGDVEANGIQINQPYYEEMDESLGKRITTISAEIAESNDAIAFKEKFGKDLDIGKPIHLRELFFDLLELTPVKSTQGGSLSVDKEVVEALDTEISKLIVERRKLEKLKGTYLSQFLRCSNNGELHPSFNLHTVSSYRSSAEGPNFQNIPIRDEESKEITRRGIIPRKGNRLLETDYAGAEAKMVGIITQDPALMAYMSDPKSDMHGDRSVAIYPITHALKQEDKKLWGNCRQGAKNKFIFPEFYGSYWGSCAPDLFDYPVAFEDDGKAISAGNYFNLDYGKFEDHVKDVEDAFWKEFWRTREWQNESVAQYLKDGYIDTPTGFRLQGFMSRNQIYNLIVQGTSYHLLQWSINRVNYIAKLEEWVTRVIFQIHDSIGQDVDPAELDHVLITTDRVMTKEVVEHWPWINIPLGSEHEITPIDGAWTDKVEIATPSL